MPIAYFITCHRSKEFIADQIQLLYRRQDLYIYHIDPKSPDDLKKYIQDLADKNNNIIIMPPRNYSWAGFSQVHTVIDAIVVALAYGRAWTHFIPLSEQHLPTTCPDTIERSLKAGTSYIGNSLYSDMDPDAQRDIRHRFDKRYIELAGVGSFATAKLNTPSEFFTTLRHGSNWYVLSRENCVRLREIFANDQKIDTLKHCVHADETIIITLSYLDPELAGSILNEDKTFVAWPHLTDNPDMIFMEDNFFQAIAEGKLFIRKRPDTLTERVKAVLGLQAPRHSRNLANSFEHQTAAEATGHRKNSIVEDLIQKEFSNGRWTLHHKSPNANIPRILMRYKTPHMPHDLSVFVVSQDRLAFKIAIVTDFGPETLYTDRTLYGRDAYMLRVRVENMFFHYELSLPDPDGGFVNVSENGNANALINKLHYYIAEAEALTF